ncbi:13495_t:CDS:2, partial [Gigaspora rosea]
EARNSQVTKGYAPKKSKKIQTQKREARLSINDARPKKRFPKVEEKERHQEVQGNHITHGKETGDSPEQCKAPGTYSKNA